MRGSDPDAAVYYLAAMLEGGEDARFIARRMVILASEDIGNADPNALRRRRRRRQCSGARGAARGAAQSRTGRDLPRAARRSRTPSRRRSPRRAATCGNRATSGRRSPFVDGTSRARKMGHGEGYVYPHDDPAGFEIELPAGRAEGQALLQAFSGAGVAAKLAGRSYGCLGGTPGRRSRSTWRLSGRHSARAGDGAADRRSLPQGIAVAAATAARPDSGTASAAPAAYCDAVDGLPRARRASVS